MDVEFLKYNFQDEYTGVIVKNGFKIGVRFIQMVYMFAGAIVLGIIRGSLGVAVLAMNDVTRQNDTYIQIHNWDMKTQGAIMSSFFFGYAVMLIPAELYFKKLNPRIVFTVMLGVNGALCMAMPTVANRGGAVAVINAMLFLGTSHAGFSAVNQALLDKWLPPNEKRVFSFLIYGGIQLGIIIGLPISGILSDQALGWELIYYSQAMLCVAMAVVYGVLTASTPDRHPAVGDNEKEFISEALKCYKKKSSIKPWKQILKSSQFWSVACAHSASNALFIFYLVNVPAFIMSFNLSLNDCCWLTMLPFIAMWLMHLTTAPTLAWISNTRLVTYIFNISNFRKLINFLGALGIVIGLTILSNISRAWPNAAVLVLTGTLGLLGFQYSGFLSSYKDMTENHSGTLMTMGCIVSSFIGSSVPFINGAIIGDDMYNHQRWRSVCITLSSVYILCNIVYTVFGSNERQQWDKHEMKDFAHYNGMTHTNQVQLEDFSPSELMQNKHEDTAC